MPTFVEIAVNVPQVSGVFHYHLPPELEGQTQPGQLVIVPFGPAFTQGVILDTVAQPEVAETKAVISLLDRTPVLTPVQIALARQLATSTLTPLAAWSSLFVPAGLSQGSENVYSLTGDWQDRLSDTRHPVSATARRLVLLLERRGELRSGQIDQSFRQVDWRPAAEQLRRRGVLASRAVLPDIKVRPKTVRTVALGCTPGEAQAQLPGLGRAGTPALERRQAVIRYLLDETGPVDVAWVYAASRANLADLHYLEKRGLIRLGQSETWRDPLDALATITAPSASPSPSIPELTADQLTAWKVLAEQIDRANQHRPVQPCLLHGVTGSGKTELYLRAVAETLRLGRQAIVLVPEIALTPQTVLRFMSRFPGQVGLLHSQLGEGERFDTWRRACSGALQVIVGPRSALAVPFSNLGLIILDECHDDSYYQSEPPFYDAREIAPLYAQLAHAVCIFGSATPNTTSTFLASQHAWKYLKLPQRILGYSEITQVSEPASPASSAGAAELPPVQIVDMRQELKSGNTSIFSQALQSGLEHVLTAKQQAILFLNRLGTATYVFCRDCGATIECPNCDLPLVYHDQPPIRPPGSPPLLSCHHCGYRRQSPKKCPVCGSTRIRQVGTGTEKVEAEVKALFPKARTLRWDATTTQRKGAHEQILSQFSARQADILVGTQMLAKGLDLPYVTLVGAVLADTGLNLPDYRSGERTFQVLTQVAGRAGRSPLGGQAFLQTFQPDNYILQAAAQHNYKSFYQRELEYRRELGYPPFVRLLRLEYRHTDAARAEEAAQGQAIQIRAWLAADAHPATQLIGPAPCFFTRLGRLYRWQLILKGPDPVSFLKPHLSSWRSLQEWRIEINPPNLL